MTLADTAALVLLIGAFTPALWMASRGQPQQRLVGMEFATIAAAMALAVLAVSWQLSFALIVPLTLVVVTLPGTLVYTRLLVRRNK